MKNIADQCKQYLMDALGVNTKLSTLPKPGALPFFLHDIYVFSKLTLLQENFIVIVPKNDEELTPATIKKHIDLVQNRLNLKAIFLTLTISSFNRKRLIEYKVPFIVPDKQMYLPDLAIDFREYFNKKRSKVIVFGPSTQAVVLYALIQKMNDAVTPKQLAEKLGYSKMTMTRSVDGIEAMGLADVTTVGRERWVCFEKNKRNLWEKALPYLKTPVKGTVWLEFISDEWPIYQSGLTALAQSSMLASNIQQVYAIGERDWKDIKWKYPMRMLEYPDEAKFTLEIWRYNPALFTKDKTVDPFSLYLSLKDMEDERIEAALEKMMEKIEW